MTDVPMTIARTKGFEACSGCSLCLLACPVWHSTHDIRYTPHFQDAKTQPAFGSARNRGWTRLARMQQRAQQNLPLRRRAR